MLAFLDATLRTVILGSAVLGLVSGALSCFAVLRRQSLLGDALAHAALPGVCLAFFVGKLLGGDAKHPLLLLGGALLTAWIGTVLILAMVRTTRLKQDAAIGIVLSVFFGIGIAMLTWLQKGFGGSEQAGLNSYLFGQAASLLPRDILVMGLLGGGALAVLAIFFRPFKAITFDPDFAASVGLRVPALEVLLTTLIVVAVVVGLQTVGVVLMAAMMVTPAAAARQWTDRLHVMVIVACLVGALSGAAGAVVSGTAARLPTGPIIVLAASAVLVVSLAVAPRRGLLWAMLRRLRNRRRVRRENLLKDLWRLGEMDGRFRALRALSDLRAVRGATPAAVRDAERAGFVAVEGTGVRLTPAGMRQAARVVRNHRIWETYLSRRLDLPDDHLHRDAEDMEHALDERVIGAIDDALGHPPVDPHGRTIPRGVPA